MRPPWTKGSITAPGKRPARNPKVEATMEYQVGDKVVHWTYGLGEIVQLDEKVISGQSAAYYVVQVGELTIWVPQKMAGPSSLRPPTPAREFKKTVSILKSPGEPLSEDRLRRKAELMELMRDGRLESLVRVVRDLSFFGKSNRLNDNDHAIFQRAQNLLVDEWHVSLSVPVHQAQHELKKLLEETPPSSKS